jgi:flagellar hook-associated protein 1 FlgK
MSLNTALNGALSGLTAAGRNASVISENIANALTPGYARRTLELTSQGDRVPGVLISGIQRHADPAITANRRDADAELSNAEVLAGFRSRLADAIGKPSDPVSLSSRLAAFSESLISAASRPESAERLTTSVQMARDLAGYLNDASRAVQDMRSEADRKIGIQVDRLNTILQQVEDLNSRIVSSDKNGAMPETW